MWKWINRLVYIQVIFIYKQTNEINRWKIDAWDREKWCSWKNNIKVDLWSGVKTVVLTSLLSSVGWSTLTLSCCLDYTHVYCKSVLVCLHMCICTCMSTSFICKVDQKLTRVAELKTIFSSWTWCNAKLLKSFLIRTSYGLISMMCSNRVTDERVSTCFSPADIPTDVFRYS